MCCVWDYLEWSFTYLFVSLGGSGFVVGFDF